MPEKRMALIAIAFGLGIAAAGSLSFISCILIIGAALVIALATAPRHFQFEIIIIAAFFLLGSARYSVSKWAAPDDVSHFGYRALAFEGKVISDPEATDKRVRLVMRVDHIRTYENRIPASGRIMVNLYQNRDEPLPDLEYGDRAIIDARPYPPSDPTNPGQFSWRGYLARQGIYSCASVRNTRQITVIRKNRTYSPMRIALVTKRYLLSSIARVHPRNESNIISGIVLGTYAYLPSRSILAFTRTGTLHILAASGFNCAVLLLAAAFVLKLLRIRLKWRNLAVIGLIVLYVMMVGPKPSLVRAAIMCSLALLAMPLRRAANYKNLFFTAFLIVLMVRPSDLFDVGFQLSFLAVWALIWVSPVIQAAIEHTSLADLSKRPESMRHFIIRLSRRAVGWNGRIAKSTTIATVAVTLVTAPVVAYHFNYISLSSMPANLVVAFCAPVIFVEGLASSVTSIIPHAGLWTGSIGTWTTRIMMSTVNYFGAINHSAISVQSPGLGVLAGYYLLLYAVVSYLRGRYARG